MKQKPTVARIVAALELVVRFYGWGVLFGRTEPPTREELENLLDSSSYAADLGVRIMGGRKVPEAERELMRKETVSACIDTIEAVGGWPHVAESAESIRQETPKYWWRVVDDYATFIKPGGMIRSGDRSMSERLFGIDGKHKIDQRTARNWLRRLLRAIAIRVLSFPVDEKEYVLSGDSLASGMPR